MQRGFSDKAQVLARWLRRNLSLSIMFETGGAAALRSSRWKKFSTDCAPICS